VLNHLVDYEEEENEEEEEEEEELEVVVVVAATVSVVVEEERGEGDRGGTGQCYLLILQLSFLQFLYHTTGNDSI